jgi:hypothetical protein
MLLFTVIGTYAQSVPNPGFEFWNISSLDNPTDYPLNSNQMANVLGLPFNCNKIVDPQQGNLAMQLNTVSNANDTLIGYFFNGENYLQLLSPVIHQLYKLQLLVQGNFF